MNNPRRHPGVLENRRRRGGVRVLPNVVSVLTLALTAGAVLGCDKSASVGGGYQISAPASPDGQTHQNRLSYNGKRICDTVLMQEYHDGTLVFMGYLQDSGQQQLFAVRGAGPRVFLSERLITNPQAFVVDDLRTGRPKPGVNYHLEELIPTADGVRVRFSVDVDETSGADVFETHDLTWPEINAMIQEAQTTGNVRNDKSGSYLFLARKPGSQVASPPGRPRHRRHPDVGEGE